jgi:hypothetical protein
VLFAFVARLELGTGGRLAASACPIAIEGHFPKPLAPGDPRFEQARQHLVDTSSSVGGVRVGPADARGCLPLEPP